MDASLFIYFPRDPGQNIYFKVLFYKKLPAPHPPEQLIQRGGGCESTVGPLTKKRRPY